MIPLQAEDGLEESEWHRLDVLARKYDRRMKVAFTRTVTQGQEINRGEIFDTVVECVAETAVGTAKAYDIGFDPSSPIYNALANDMTDQYMKVVTDDSAVDKVKQIIPRNLSLTDRRNRLDVFGLDARSAVRLERMRQDGASAPTLYSTRINMQLQRGNLIALTEVNRIVNATVDTIWMDNVRVISKAKRPQREWEYGGEWFAEGGPLEGRTITTLRGIPAEAEKSIVTRRDNRVCNYCLPLEGISTPLGSMFRTRYGNFRYPPFHPRCRCYMIVRY